MIANVTAFVTGPVPITLSRSASVLSTHRENLGALRLYRDDRVLFQNRVYGCRSLTTCRMKRGSGGKRSTKGRRPSSSNNKRSNSNTDEEGMQMQNDSANSDNVIDIDALSANSDDNLTQFFEEDINSSSRLNPTASANNTSRASRRLQKSSNGRNKRSFVNDSKRNDTNVNGNDAAMKRFTEALPKSRDEFLNLLVRGAWFGVFALVALFLTVHLVIVRDWLPSQK